jgi:glycosyltransferase involved in cell wall biosynthesis
MGFAVPAAHILIPIHDFSAGGTEFVACLLARGWLAAGRRVTFLAGASDGPVRARVPDGADIHVLSPECPRSPTSRLSLGARMAPVAAALAPDAIFLPGNFHLGLGHALKRALPHAAIVGKISNPLLTPPLDRLPHALTRPLLRRLTRGIDWFAALSAGLAAESRALLGHDRATPFFNPHIPDNAVIAFTPRPPLAPGAPLRLTAIGRLDEQKDFPLALRTIAALRRDGSDATLRILGEGPLRAALTREVGRLGLAGAVQLPGFSDRIDAELAETDLLLVTSRYEGGPAVAIEALVQGVPVVSTDCSHFLRELIADPSFGVLVGGVDPAALARAARAQAGQAGPRPEHVARAVAPLRHGRSSAAYLELFDRLT